MTKPFVPEKELLGRVINLGDFAGIGMNVSICFQPGVGAIVVKTIPEKVMNEIIQSNTVDRDIWKKGTLLRNTQHHMLPVGQMPIAMHNQWKQELGDPKRDPDAVRRWKKRWNSREYHKLRTSEYNI